MSGYKISMYLVGITGGIASGKTEVAKVFKKLGARVISGDKLGQEVVKKNKLVLRRLVQVFSKSILNKNGNLNRKRLGELAFFSKSNIRKLNSIVHPHLLSSLKRQIKKLERSKDVVVVDAALIVEWGIQKQFDFLILVDSKRGNQLKRFCSSRKYSSNTAREIIRCQLPKKSKRRYADLVIDNNGNLKQLKEKARKVWSVIFALSRKKKKRSIPKNRTWKEGSVCPKSGS
ncbi:MAG: dephospho-CoA kinase [candidate division Zixibacteria bacterium]|nr:dephospho-CoA kinase [candidate division Zixibacteria bacterium]